LSAIYVLLAAQIKRDMSELLKEWIEAALNDLKAAKEAIDSPNLGNVLERVRTDFHRRFEEIEEALRKRLNDNGVELKERWVSVEDDRIRASRLVRECLAFIQGCLMRSNGATGEFCAIADAFLEELNNAARLGWKSFTLPADGESFAKLAELIRLRFPVTGIWHLPIAAHEFGHYAADWLRPREPDTAHYQNFNQFLGCKRKQALEAKRHWGRKQIAAYNEFFADAFATFALGPAYARTCIYVRFNPALADVESDDEHPSFSRRAYLILKILERMNGASDFAPARESSRAWWQQATEGAGKTEIKSNTELDGIARDMVRFLRECALDVEYSRWPYAQALSGRMLEDKPASDVIEARDSIADVLNASWILRISRNPAWPSDRISRRAFDSCREILKRGQVGGAAKSDMRL
jgi:hypothetical protein